MFTEADPLHCKSLYYSATLVWPQQTLVTLRLKSYATASCFAGHLYGFGIEWEICSSSSSSSSSSVFCIMAHPEAQLILRVGK